MDDKIEDIKETLRLLGAKDPDQKKALPRGTGKPNTIKVNLGKGGAIIRTYEKDNGYRVGTFQLPGGPERITFDEEAAVRANNPEYSGRKLFTKDNVDKRFSDLVKENPEMDER